MNKDEFIKIYAEIIIKNKASLFLGAGFSENSNLPSWEKLFSKCVKDLGISSENETDYLQIAQYYEIQHDRNTLEALIDEQINNSIEPNKNLSDFLSLNFPNIWTTNFDKAIERSLDSNRISYNVITNDDNLKIVSDNKVNIFKCGGDIESHQNLFITKNDYEDYQIKRTTFLSFLKRELIINNFLFIGYSFKDGLMKHQLRSINSIIGNTTKHYAILFKKTSETFQYHINDLERNYNINVITVQDEREFFAVINALSAEVKKHYVYISGSTKKLSDNSNILPLCKTLSNKLLSNNFFLVSAAGSHIGNYIFGAALKYLEQNNYEQIRKRLIIDPIPNSLENSEIKNHRIRLLSKCKSIIFIAGDRGTREEYNLAKKLNLELIPIPCTGGEAKNIFTELKKDNLTDLAVLENEVEINKIVDTVIATLIGKRG